MKLIFTITVLFFVMNSCAESILKYVNVFIGTAGDHGQMDPAATVPFGMIKPGPDTYPQNHGGYNFNAAVISGFSHNRFSGTGCDGVGGNLRILPGTDSISKNGSPIDKSSEKASPGFYGITFLNKINVQLTASNFTAFHKITFPPSEKSNINFSFTSSFTDLLSYQYTKLNDNEIVAEISAKNTCGFGRYTQYYHIWCSQSLKNLDTIAKGNAVLWFSNKQQKEVLLKVTVSPVSCDEARNEWNRVARHQSFEQIKKTAAARWEKALSAILVEGEEVRKILFYTHLYHTLLNPVRLSNKETDFKTSKGEVIVNNKYVPYSGWSIWDNYRNKLPLIAMLYPQLARDINMSLASLYTGKKTAWGGDDEPAPTVRTDHAVVALLDFYMRGYKEIPLKNIYQALKEEVEMQAPVSPDGILEQSYDWWALAQLAKQAGFNDDYSVFMKKTLNYKSNWEKYFRVITARSDIMHGEGLYEGTLWQYRWAVPFDIEGMISLAGGKDSFALQLETFFDSSYYHHGNQPDIHAAYLFNYCGKPWLTQKWVHTILHEDMQQWYGTHEKWKQPYTGKVYQNKPEGYIPEMDDDDGTMAAWYVLSSVGLYPVTPGVPEFQMTSPSFNKVIIRLEGDKKFIIQANKEVSAGTKYINAVTLNKKEHHKTTITHKEIMNGGILNFYLSELPDIQWFQ